MSLGLGAWGLSPSCKMSLSPTVKQTGQELGGKFRAEIYKFWSFRAARICKQCRPRIASPKAKQRVAPGLGGNTSGERWRDDRSAECAEWGEVWGGVSTPQPTRKCGERRELTSRVREPRPKTHFWHIFGSQNTSDRQKNAIFCPV